MVRVDALVFSFPMPKIAPNTFVLNVTSLLTSSPKQVSQLKMTMGVEIAQQVVDAILAGVRSATVDVQDVSEARDFSQLHVVIVSKYFENLPKFKRRDMVNSSLNDLRRESWWKSAVTLEMLSPSEAAPAAEE